MKTKSWEFFLGLLEQYIQRNGTTIVPVNYINMNGDRLGNWVVAQRQAFKKGKLSRDRQQALEQLPGWVWDHSEALWQEGFKYLREYHQQKGHANVPTNYVTEDDYNLGSWVATQQAAYKKGKLSLERQQTLEQLPGWLWKPKNNRTPDTQQWQEWFNRLRQFVERKGHSSVPLNYQTEDGYFLGAWVQTQRAAYKTGKLPLERQQALEQLPGWVWDKRQQRKRKSDQQRWQQWFNRLRQFVEREHNTNVSVNYITEDNYNLGNWVWTQRVAYKKGKLTLERRQALEQLPGWVWGERRKSYGWNECYNYLRKYVKREGSSNVPGNYKTKDGFNLGQWVRNQRSKYSTGKLSMKQQILLEKIPQWVWHVPRARWAENFKRLSEYVKREGNARVPASYVEEDGFKLGQWVMWNREKHKHQRLSRTRQRMLEQLPGWVWRPREEQNGFIKNKYWSERLERLREYSSRNGHACVPLNYITEDGCKLGTWVRDQRYEHKKGNLSKEQGQALEQLFGWEWHSKEEQRGFTKYWSERLERLREYSARNGHACVPSNYVTEDGYKLGTWVRDQRYQHEKGRRKLSKEQEQALEQMPGWVWNATKRCGFRRDSNKWMDVFECLCKYVDLKGNSCVSYNYVAENGLRLGLWVTHQRQVYKKGKLSLERQQALEQLPGWKWDMRKTST